MVILRPTTQELALLALDELITDDPALLPPGVALDINYPTLAPEDVKGVKLTVQGQASSASLTFVPIGGGLCIPAVGPGSGDEADV